MPISLKDYHQLALMSLWTGLIATVGIVFAFIPNVELVILSAFLGGTALGAKRGFIAAVVGEAIFSALNPIGSGLGFPILFLFQMTSVGLSGWLGGVLGPRLQRSLRSIHIHFLLGVIGFLLTLFYDVLTALSFPISGGMVDGTIWGSLVAGLIFFIIHLVSNTTLFTLFAPSLIRLIENQLQMYGLGRGPAS